ncbi:MAG: IPT/TIG domain-containing protein [Gemmatimonadota bacterium]
MTPPGPPQLSRIRAEVPSAGQTTVRGETGAVEGLATVRVDNAAAAARGSSPAAVEVRASNDGAFAARVAAQAGDELSLVAKDDAGNASQIVRIPAGPGPETFRLAQLSGSGQTGVTGRALTEPFQVRVRGGTPAMDLSGVEVLFEVVSGSGSLDRASARSEEGGVATARLTLPAAQGVVRVRAHLAGSSQEVLFEAEATGAPEIVTVSTGAADRGTEITVIGRNFSPVASHNVVEFNGVEGEVRSAQRDRLGVRVPAFGSDGPLTVTLTGVRSNGVPFLVKGEPPPLPAVGSAETVRLTPSAGGVAAELRLGFLAGTEEYVVAVQALTSSSGQFRHGIAGDLAGPSLAEPEIEPPASSGGPGGQMGFDSLLRRREAQLAKMIEGKPRTSGLWLSGGEPQVGDREEFRVIHTDDPAADIGDGDNFDTVTAVLRYKGAHTLVFVDERTPALDLTDADVRQVGDRFERQSYVVDRQAFGDESDIDGDGRVTILLTPTVNELNRGSDPRQGIIIGFFFGIDLLPGFFPATTNAREIFYGFVPDPSGRFGTVIPRDFALPTLDEVFAHEFQHMISFNEKVLVRGGQSEDTWLNEGLSSIAEDLNGFDDGNLGRTAFFLDAPGEHGLALPAGPDGLGQRGAAFTFLRHLGDQLGQDVYRALVQTNATGVGNVELATGRAFSELFADWISALLLDDATAGDPRFQIPSLELRAAYEHVRQLNPSLGFGPYLALQTLNVPGGNLNANSVGTAGVFATVRTSAGSNERILRVTAPASSQAQVTVVRTR